VTELERTENLYCPIILGMAVKYVEDVDMAVALSNDLFRMLRKALTHLEGQLRPNVDR
jgi:hypothetical protein